MRHFVFINFIQEIFQWLDFIIPKLKPKIISFNYIDIPNILTNLCSAYYFSDQLQQKCTLVYYMNQFSLKVVKYIRF